MSKAKTYDHGHMMRGAEEIAMRALVAWAHEVQRFNLAGVEDIDPENLGNISLRDYQASVAERAIELCRDIADNEDAELVALHKLARNYVPR
jgi:hypothetical protein